jgi:hypothetical protein
MHVHGHVMNVSTINPYAGMEKAAAAQRAAEVSRKLKAAGLDDDGELGSFVGLLVGDARERSVRPQQSQPGKKGGANSAGTPRFLEQEEVIEPLYFWV